MTSYRILRWSVLRTRFPFPYNVYLIVAAIFGHFFLLNVHLEAALHDVFQTQTGVLEHSCTRYALLTHSKLMLLYLAFVFLGAAAAIDKFFCPVLIEMYEDEAALVSSNDISTLEAIGRHFESTIKNAWKPVIARGFYYRLAAIREEALLMLKRQPRASNEDELALTKSYKSVYYAYIDLSYVLVPAANLMVVIAGLITLGIAVTTLLTITCTAYHANLFHL